MYLQTAGGVIIVGCYSRSLLYTLNAYSGYKNAGRCSCCWSQPVKRTEIKNQIALNEAIAQCRIFTVQ